MHAGPLACFLVYESMRALVSCWDTRAIFSAENPQVGRLSTPQFPLQRNQSCRHNKFCVDLFSAASSALKCSAPHLRCPSSAASCLHRNDLLHPNLSEDSIRVFSRRQPFVGFDHDERSRRQRLLGGPAAGAAAGDRDNADTRQVLIKVVVSVVRCSRGASVPGRV